MGTSGAQPSSSRGVAATLTDAFPPEVRAQAVAWTYPTDGQLLNACATATGAAGPDGWSSAVLRQLPPAVIGLFHKLILPDGWTPPRCRRHCVKAVAHTRPISIESICWRTFAMTCTKDCSEFCQIPAQRRAGAEDAAAWLQDVWRTERDGEICSLDWSKAFDRTQPAAMNQTLQNLGWPANFCNILQQTQQHERWIAWDGEVGDSPLQVTTAIPQAALFRLCSWQL